MSKPKKKSDKGKQENQNILTEAERKALEKLDQTALLIEIGNQKGRIEELQAEVYNMTQSKRSVKDENLELTLKMERDINEKGEQIIQLQYEYETYKRQSEEKFNQIIDEKDKKYTSALEKHVQDTKDKDRKIEDLTNQITRLSHFEEREEDYIKRLADLEAKYTNQEYAHNDQMKKMEKNFIKQNQNIESVNKAKIEDIIRNADKIAEKKVHDSEERTKKENKKLRQELETHQRELEQLKKEKLSMTEENKVIKKNQFLNQDGAIEYQQINHLQTVKIKKLKEKVEYLKNFISEEVSKYTKEIEFMKYQHTTKVQENDYQIKTLKEQLLVRSRELKNVKALAQMILDQRSDIEQFFLQAIDQVKGDIKKKAQQERKTKLPDITKNSHQASGSLDEQKSKFYNDKVDINDLDLEEKEKLLRILFSKMNQGIPAGHWKEKSMENSSFQDQKFQPKVQQQPEFEA